MRISAGLVASLCVLLGGSAAQAAKLGDNTVRLLPSKFKLLQNIGPMRFTGENRYSDRRLGRSFGFGTSGISLIVYVYDFGLKDLPDGPDSVPVCEQFEKAKFEIEEGGNYQNIVLHAESTRRMKDSADAPRVREALYQFDRNGVHAWSYLWITVADGYFVKLRLSLRDEVKDEIDEAREEILATIADALGAQPPRPAPTEKPAETSIDIDPGTDPVEASSWFSYAAELLRASRETPGAMPPCGGVLLPRFSTELAARRVALRDYEARDAAVRNSEYFSLLSRIDAAGFLDEYVWHYLRGPAEQEAPAGLDLAAFETFRAQELAAHTPKTGAHVRVNTVRQLPVVPAP